jgi:PncC family amidohydrolase
MAAGARTKSGVECSIAVTGIAGPSGGSTEKPVGTVFVAIDTLMGQRVERLSLSGDRTAIQERTAKTAINLTRLLLEEAGY